MSVFRKEANSPLRSTKPRSSNSTTENSNRLTLALRSQLHGGYGEGVNTSGCEPLIRGFKSHYPPHRESKGLILENGVRPFSILRSGYFYLDSYHEEHPRVFATNIRYRIMSLAWMETYGVS